MVHTYVFKDGAAEEDFRRLCRRIERIAPGYVRAEEQSFDEGVKSIRWVQGERAILAEIEPAYRAVTVCSDEPLPKLAALAERWKKRGGVGRFLSRFARSSRIVKFVIIPLLLSAIAAAELIYNTGPLAALILPGIPVAALEDMALFGWWLLLPAGAAIMKLADRKMVTVVRWTAAALPAFSAVYACLFSRDILPEFMGGLLTHFPCCIPLALYIVALPYLIINDMAKRRLEKVGAVTGERRAFLPGAAFAGLAISVMASFSGLAENYLNSCEKERELKISMAERQMGAAQRELIAVKYSSDMEAAARYALEKDCYDWSECPDESLEEQWERLFAGGAAAPRVFGGDDGEIGFKIYGQDYWAEPGKSITAYYYGNNIIVSLEAEE